MCTLLQVPEKQGENWKPTDLPCFPRLQIHRRFLKPIYPELNSGFFFLDTEKKKQATITKMMMQLQETPNQKNSLFNAMNRFLGAVNNMDQTIMVPSLLRDVPLEEDKEMSSLKSDVEEGDMYSYYQLLKSIRRDMEWGINGASADDRHLKFTRMNSSTSSISFGSLSSEEDEEEEDEDLEKQFQYHLTGLQGVLSKLTQQADTLTKRYKKEIGIGGWDQ